MIKSIIQSGILIWLGVGLVLYFSFDALRVNDSTYGFSSSASSESIKYDVVSGMKDHNLKRLKEVEESLSQEENERRRFSYLGDAAKLSFTLGKYENARKYAEELMQLIPKFTERWNYGQALHDGNLVMGRLACRAGDLEKAKDYLLKSGDSPGSAVMNSFGPNMGLAKDLLEEGERDVVLQYFELCRKFWNSEHQKLDEWIKVIEKDEIPDFGANLIF